MCSVSGPPLEQAAMATTPTFSSGKPRTVSPISPTTADFVKGIFEYGKSIGQVSPVAHYRDTDYVTFKDAKGGRSCIGFRRVGKAQRGGYDALTGGILCRTTGEDHH